MLNNGVTLGNVLWAMYFVLPITKSNLGEIPQKLDEELGNCNLQLTPSWLNGMGNSG